MIWPTSIATCIRTRNCRSKTHRTAGKSYIDGEFGLGGVGSRDLHLGKAERLFEFEGRPVDLIELRQTLEVTAAGLAAQRRDEDDIEQLRALLVRRNELWAPHHVEPHNVEEAISTDIAVHRAVVAASHNALYLELYDSLLGLMDHYMRGNPDLIELRQTLEVTAAGLAAQRRDEDDIEQLRALFFNYVDPHYIYPPGGTLLLAPFGYLPVDASRYWFITINTIAIVIAAYFLLRLFNFTLASVAAPALLLAMFCTESVTNTLVFTNINGVVLLLEVLQLRRPALHLSTGRHVTVGALRISAGGRVAVLVSCSSDLSHIPRGRCGMQWSIPICDHYRPMGSDRWLVASTASRTRHHGHPTIGHR